MKKYYSIIWSMCLILLAGVTLTACDDGDELSTDQYGNEIKLNSFGPCPVLRGGVLKFLGSNLDQITEVDLPGADPITAIDIKASGTHSEIWINVPKEKCEPGIVTLKTAKGGEIKTLTPVTYEENIVLSTIYIGQEGNLEGNVGDILTFKGDYLNLMHEVIFADDVRVPETEFLAHDRYTISVAIPKEAKTGKPMLSDTNPEGENLLYPDNAITISLPTAAVTATAPVKAGDVVTVKGTALNLIESVELNGAEVPAEGITVTDGNKQLLFYLPATATDGEVTLVTFSGVKIPAGNIETVVPTELSAAPAPVKNGADITISGKDLDLVTAISFPKADGELKSVAAGKVVAAVPETAQEGDITLSLANGKQVTVAYTLVKPTVTECTPNALVAGEKVIIKGTDLDLVASVTLPGETPQTVSEFAAQNEKAIALTVPAACAGSGLILNLKNGTSVEASGLTIQAATDPATSESSYTGMITKEITITGKNFNNVQNVYIGSERVTKYSEKTNTSMTFTVPATLVKGEYDLVMEDYSGVRYTVAKFIAKPAETDLWTGSVGPCDWSGSHIVNITSEMAAEMQVGKTLAFDFECDPNAGWWQVEIISSWWSDLPSLTALNGGERPIMSIDPANPHLEFTIAQEDLDVLFNQGNLFLFVGNGCIVKRIYVK
ncbi:MAG: IPT/TIG domain-containing protein [Prevotella sp.]